MDTHTSAGTQAPSGPVPTAVAGRPAADRDRRITGWRVPRSWPLLPVLVVQAVLSLRLVRADTAFQDEALYLWAGHLQWAHWLHGTVIPPFAYYFAGAPVIYPPLGALADSIGDLAGARMLSLVFMLGATILVWSTTRRLFGRRSAFFAAALFAVLGPTLQLGALATTAAPSVFLVALAAWLVMRSGTEGRARARMVAAGVALGLANATGKCRPVPSARCHRTAGTPGTRPTTRSAITSSRDGAGTRSRPGECRDHRAQHDQNRIDLNTAHGADLIQIYPQGIARSGFPARRSGLPGSAQVGKLR